MDAALLTGRNSHRSGCIRPHDVIDSHPQTRGEDAGNDRRTDLKLTDAHYSWREVYRRLDCPALIDPAPADDDLPSPADPLAVITT